MKVTYNWLKDYLKSDISPDKLADKLTMGGLEVTSLEKTTAGDWLMDLEVTTNRPDWLSVLGVAREAGAITAKPISLPPGSISKAVDIKDQRIEAVILDPRGCPRYTARLVTNLEPRPTPQWMKERLEAVGLRPINLIVDITNFVLLEYGQPLHAFDYDKLKGSKLFIRRARKTEKLLVIDQKLIELDPEMLVIADKDRPAALAGIIGGKNSEVDPGTKNVLLESAYFDPILIRKTSRKLGLVTESSYRFERRINLEAVAEASSRACHLLEKLAGAKIDRTIVDIGKKICEREKICLDPLKVNQTLGVELSAKRICDLLNRLDLKAVIANDKAIEVEIPSFRRDLTRPIDLIEEAGRIYGYQNIPVVTPKIKVSTLKQDLTKSVELKVRRLLVSAGLSEIINYSLISRNTLKKINMQNEKVVSVKNPLTREQEIMRPGLLGGMLTTVSRNKDRRIDDVRIFELSRVYLPEGVKKLPVEQLNLSIAFSGKKLPSWRVKRGPFDFYDLKGLLEVCLADLKITDYRIIDRQYPWLNPASSACLEIGSDYIGYLGEAAEDLLDNFDLNSPVYILECNFDKLVSHSVLKKKFKPVIKYPAVCYDVAVVVKEAIASGEVISLVRAAGGKLVNRVDLFDVYRGKQVPEGCKSLAYSVEYQAVDRTLTTKEVDQVHSKIRQDLEKKLGARIR
ncbi:MAG: phenylalanine--tRNA ligase subunit beta [Candidatus Omnitrophota bacterium]|nr:phenylalanine--tRNA ligase subunit beta [Candidatus Omnitrophota bacterium]